MAAIPASICARCWRALHRPLGLPVARPIRGAATEQWYRKAMPAPGETRRARQTAARWENNPNDTVLAATPIPPLSFWEGREALTGATGISAQEYMDTATKYRALAANPSVPWKATLETEHGLPRRTLYYTAVLLFLVGARSNPEAGRLGMHMLRTASDVGYAPATLTLRRLAMRAAPATDSSSTSSSTSSTAAARFLHAVDANFAALVRDGRNADALTLQGELLLLAAAEAGAARDGAAWQKKEEARALEVLDRAVRVGERVAAAGAAVEAGTEVDAGAAVEARAADAPEEAAKPRPRPPRWAWEARCHLARGRVLLREGRRAEAEAALRVAALELDSREALVELAGVVPADDPQQREQYLLKAAVSGDREACGQLGELERQKAEGPAARDAGWHERVATEWARLAA